MSFHMGNFLTLNIHICVRVCVCVCVCVHIVYIYSVGSVDPCGENFEVSFETTPVMINELLLQV